MLKIPYPPFDKRRPIAGGMETYGYCVKVVMIVATPKRKSNSYCSLSGMIQGKKLLKEILLAYVIINVFGKGKTLVGSPR